MIVSLFMTLLPVLSLTAAPPFPIDAELQSCEGASAEACLEVFLAKGGSFQSVMEGASFTLLPGDAVYPVCSGGFCRSQTLWALLLPYAHQIILFPPHAARHGWDPYNRKINRYRNQSMESGPDEFILAFGIDKAVRFGFDQATPWETANNLSDMTAYYDTHYYGPESHWQGSQGQRRVYIAFANNTHVVLRRLVQTNDCLDGVIVIGIDYEDLISYPPASLNTHRRSQLAYEYFANKLTPLLNLSEVTK